MVEVTRVSKSVFHGCSVKLTLSVLGRIFIFILLTIYRFSTASKTHVGIEIVQTLVISLLTSIDHT